ncbi:MAG TPA: hypothetical protein DDW31_00500 [candidate division Zixibacteria bacterium]|jgi:predicted  nucleic acid-binding Zn-ribbon protein|nr:hypothetical protein [candidate division Zixibacteria bacterium]
MHPQLELLVTLHDLELTIKEATEDAANQKALGFKIDNLEHIIKAQADIEKQVDHGIIDRYRKLKERYGRPVVPVINSICCGCYIRMPTAQASDTERNQRMSTCGNCGRFLYWVSE